MGRFPQIRQSSPKLIQRMHHNFPREGRTSDQHDAYSLAALDAPNAIGTESLIEYFEPNLLPEERGSRRDRSWIWASLIAPRSELVREPCDEKRHSVSGLTNPSYTLPICPKRRKPFFKHESSSTRSSRNKLVVACVLPTWVSRTSREKVTSQNFHSSVVQPWPSCRYSRFPRT